MPKEEDVYCKTALDKAFLTAWLLTASIEQAESAVVDAVSLRDSEQCVEDTFFKRVLCIAIRKSHDRARNEKQSIPFGSSLPVELQQVIRLQPELRRVFVLRMLAGQPRETCAQLLNVPGRVVDELVCTACQTLALPVELQNLAVI